jgi:membrane associated rhomboid family serine protease
VITSGFIHSDWNHLIMNMLSFFFFAFSLEHTITYLQSVNVGEIPTEGEQRFATILGHTKFFLIYFISMIVADLTTIIKYKDIPGYGSLGASGAISGMIMSAVILAPAMDMNIMIFGFLPGWLFAIMYLSYSYYAARRMMDNVAHEAHLWGAIAGIIFTFALLPKEAWKFVEMLHDTFYGWLN